MNYWMNRGGVRAEFREDAQQFIRMSNSQSDKHRQYTSSASDNKRSHYTWSLDDRQIAAFEAWRDEIWRTDKRHPGVSGGTFTFKITGTTIGTIIKASYRDGEKELDLTDYNSW